MGYRVLTVSREYGSGGAQIAKLVADRIGWTLLDGQIIDEVARMAHVDPSVARGMDERTDSWFHRLNRGSFRATALMAGVNVDREAFFDADLTVELTGKIIERAYQLGNCVIVGRGGQCILGKCSDVFRVYVYAPEKCKMARLRERLRKDCDLSSTMRAVDAERARYGKQCFNRRWDDPHLYNLMISSEPGDEVTAATILYAFKGCDTQETESNESVST